jgi:tetratricopeptide (TPR) repeat protein
MEVAVSRQPGPFHRAWSLFLLDHGRDVSQVLAKAEQEIQTRRDIYGYDLLAWALHAAGRDAEAQPAIQRALALGTRDAMLFYHAGMIQRSLGHDGQARQYLELARQTNPHWRP